MGNLIATTIPLAASSKTPSSLYYKEQDNYVPSPGRIHPAQARIVFSGGAK